MDLTTRYMGLDLENPLVASASPLNADVEYLRRLEDAGAAAVVLPSLFEEQIEAEAARYDHLTSVSAESAPEARSYCAEPAGYSVGPHAYLDLVRRASAALDIPVIASLNGTTDEGWLSYASAIEAAGAKGLELNVYFIPADLSLSGAQVEQRYLDIVRRVRATVSIPVAVKLNPYFSAVGNMALALEGAGADALVLFNRFYQPDIDLGRLELLPDLQLSHPNEIRLPLLWIGLLSGRVKASLAATTGVTTADEVDQVSSGRRRRGDDDVCAPASWRDAHDRPAARPGSVALGAPVLVRTADARSHEPTKVAGGTRPSNEPTTSRSSRAITADAGPGGPRSLVGDRGRRESVRIVGMTVHATRDPAIAPGAPSSRPVHGFVDLARHLRTLEIVDLADERGERHAQLADLALRRKRPAQHRRDGPDGAHLESAEQCLGAVLEVVQRSFRTLLHADPDATRVLHQNLGLRTSPVDQSDVPAGDLRHPCGF